ncbi:MAG: BolA/IbaG family iron-sulfur metabolism protein [Gammaproteobacteria bacterium]|nr:BolA/IbaG family iron-sulfur metabolism protein [Gammaproteobacteria bacterium]NND40375.1 BolA/IbaG family iron-sulfur metabolism protein [Pseudomonadales bacterium]MBT8150528.1 BolA/IbaG family iron-sulfur metabolism protein [Gammaproteobacteria bacterium]NNL10411.1 BolA/IbaG family iron-sulfur metabolism protein [Pseudomonadales bacterium]NNM12562.1 BolA/IbaG family iron-sulfur metabolism protein [Pseudomonadales bacterium]
MQDTIAKRLREAIAVEHLEVNMDGDRCALLVVSDAFEGLNAVKRQQLVYQHIGEFISSGEIHAVSINALTGAQWRAK